MKTLEKKLAKMGALAGLAASLAGCQTMRTHEYTYGFPDAQGQVPKYETEYQVQKSPTAKGIVLGGCIYYPFAAISNFGLPLIVDPFIALSGDPQKTLLRDCLYLDVPHNQEEHNETKTLLSRKQVGTVPLSDVPASVFQQRDK